ncbi:hypothetical protein HYS50_02935 [Candidatus Woesearchaeota archaeon]|nr:hypothetical protein [Candidatus Woesearchaeota archaeon]
MKPRYVITLSIVALLLLIGISFAVMQPSEADVLKLFLTKEQITALASQQQAVSPLEALGLRIAGKTLPLPASRPLIEGKVVEESEEQIEQLPASQENAQVPLE